MYLCCLIFKIYYILYSGKTLKLSYNAKLIKMDPDRGFKYIYLSYIRLLLKADPALLLSSPHHALQTQHILLL